MTNWRYRIELAKVLEKCNENHDLSHYEEECPQDVKDLIAAEISKAWPLTRLAPRVTESKTIAELNRVLQLVYDVADAELVWCGI
jgi:flagellar motor switch protein FliM